jgi:hypothetical protein
MLLRYSQTFCWRVVRCSNIAIKKAMTNTTAIAGFCQRSEVNFVDLVSYFYKIGLNIDLLIDFVKSKKELQTYLREKDNQKYVSSLSKSSTI